MVRQTESLTGWQARQTDRPDKQLPCVSFCFIPIILHQKITIVNKLVTGIFQSSIAWYWDKQVDILECMHGILAPMSIFSSSLKTIQWNTTALIECCMLSWWPSKDNALFTCLLKGQWNSVEQINCLLDSTRLWFWINARMTNSAVSSYRIVHA